MMNDWVDELAAGVLQTVSRVATVSDLHRWRAVAARSGRETVQVRQFAELDVRLILALLEGRLSPL